MLFSSLGLLNVSRYVPRRIYKEKYMGDDEDTSHSRGRSATTSSHEKKNRGKSRTRSIFHRKKSFAAGA